MNCQTETQKKPADEIESTPPQGSSAPVLTPEVDIYDHQDFVTVVADVPGVHESGLRLLFEGDTLSLDAQIATHSPSPMLHREYRTGNYQRRFRIGENVDMEKITASLVAGVLTVTLPKSQPVRRQITINAAS